MENNIETNLKFNSQVCTTKIQSERLLALGLNSDTADMGLIGDIPIVLPTTWANADPLFDTPAWSLHRLLELFIEVNGNFFDWEFEISPGKLIISRSNRMMFVWSKNVYDSIITCIEWLIKSGYFNKDYLEE